MNLRTLVDQVDKILIKQPANLAAAAAFRTAVVHAIRFGKDRAWCVRLIGQTWDAIEEIEEEIRRLDG